MQKKSVKTTVINGKTIRITRRHYDAALSLANKVRTKIGKKPVKRLQKGHPCEAHSCVIARTIGSDIFVWPYADQRGCIVSRDIEMTDVIVRGGKLPAQFAIAFDNGDIPELDEGGGI